MRPTIKIAHLSDLHLDARSANEVQAFDHLINSVRRFEPDIIAVTGDLQDSPTKDNLVLIKQKLAVFAEIVHDGRLIVIPGNHDCRAHGWAPNWQFLPWWRANDHDYRKEFFGAFPLKPAYFDDLKLAMYPFDSNGDGNILVLARGKISQEQIGRFTEWQDQMKSREGFGDATKIALVHHHPLRIAETESGRLGDDERLLELENAATLLQTLLDAGFDLVLHGHRHFHAVSRYGLPERVPGRQILVIAAASATKSEEGAHSSYNQIAVGPDKSIQLARPTMSHGAFELNPRQITIQSYREVVEQIHAASRAVASAKLTARRIIWRYDITKSCDVDLVIEYRDLRALAKGKAVENYELSVLDSEAIGWCRHAETNGRQAPRVDIKNAPNDTDGRHIQLTFTPPVEHGQPDFNLTLFLHCFAPLAATEEETQKFPKPASARRVGASTKIPADVLGIVVRHQEITSPRKTHRVRVIDNHGGDVAFEAGRVNAGRLECRDAYIASLIIDRPLPGLQYLLEWDPPGQLVEENKDGNAIVLQLLRLAEWKTPPQNLTRSLEQVIDVLCPNNSTKGVDFGLMVFDSETKKLRHVAGIFRNPLYWRWELPWGSGVAGRALRLDKALCWIEGVDRAANYYYPGPEIAEVHEVVFSIPIRFPKNASPVAVFSLCSEKKDSWLATMDLTKKADFAQAVPMSGLLPLGKAM